MFKIADSVLCCCCDRAVKANQNARVSTKDVQIFQIPIYKFNTMANRTGSHSWECKY